MTNKQRRRALEIARANGGGHAPLRWVWPVNNCFFTGIPLPGRQHVNAVKCNYAYQGPSDRTKAKRVARGKSAKPAYL